MNTRQIVKLCDDLLRTVLDRPDEEEGDPAPADREPERIPDPDNEHDGPSPDKDPTTSAATITTILAPALVPPAAPETGGVDWPAAWDGVAAAGAIDITPTAHRYAGRFGFTDAQIIEAASNPASIDKLSGGDWGHHRAGCWR